MSLSVTCPDCDKTLRVKDELAGKKVRCPGCSTVIPIPAKELEADDDVEFLDDLEEPTPSKRKRRVLEDDLDDDDDEPVSRSRSRQ